MNTTNEKLAVANEIARQIDGAAFFMMGTTEKFGDETSLSFNVRGSRIASKIKVTLDPATDTYEIDFYKIRKYEIVSHQSVERIYGDALCRVIERYTGLALSL